jgi:tetratricopeptide (TPR) repeat protein
VLLQLGQLERAARYLKETEVLALTLGDRQRLAWVWAYTTTALLFAGEPVPAMAVGEKARVLADEVGDTALRASARTPLAHACRERGDLRRSVTVFGEAIGLLTGELVYQRFGQAVPPAIYARGVAAVSLAELGEFGEAIRLATEAQALTQLTDLPFRFAVAQLALGNIHLLQNRIADTLKVLEPALAVIQARGILFPWVTALRGYALALSGHTEEGCAVLAGALEDAVKLRFFFAHSQWISWLAHAHLLAGRTDEAREQADEALRLSRQRGQRGYEALALYVRGKIESLHERDSAETLCRQALALADELGMRPLVAHCHLALGNLYRRTDERKQAREHLTTATTMYRDMGMAYWLEKGEMRELG